jgi:hypothetical protein
MFSFWRRPQTTRPSPAIAKALAGAGLPPGLDPATLEMVQQRGSYAGRSVNRFRVFDPAAVAARATPVRAYVDFDSHPELVIRAGHVEHDGAVVLIRPAVYIASSLPARLVARRADHVDDEQFVREYTETPGPVSHV